MTTKVCKGCGAEKGLPEFYRMSSNMDGRMGKCKACVRARVRENRRERLEQYAR